MEDLTKLPLFMGLDPSLVLNLIQSLPEKSYKKNELIINQGDRGLTAYLLIKGKVEVFYRSREDERTTTIIFHKAPFIFGEVELWEEHPYLANVQAVEDCETLMLSKKNYVKLLHSNHQLCINLVRMLSNLLWRTGEDRRVRIFGNVDNHLANLIYSFAHLFGEKHAKGILLRKKINKKEIAEILGFSRQSIIRSFGNLTKENLIFMEDKELIIPNLVELRKRARNL